MYRSLVGLSERVLFDSMVLLNAAFVRDGVARRAVGALLSMGYSLCVDDTSWMDSCRVLAEKRASLGLAYDPMPVFEQYSIVNRMVHLPPSPTIPNSSVNRSDRHLLNAATDRNAWVLTEDAPLIHQLIGSGVEVRNTWDVLYEALAGEDPPLNFVGRITPLSRTEGYIFGRIVTGGWAARRGDGKYTICDIENVGQLYYDNSAGAWVIYLRNGLSVSLNCDLAQDEIWVVCASYRLPSTSGSRGNVTIRSAGPTGTRKNADATTLKSLPMSERIGQVSLGHSVSGSDHFNGHIRAVVTGANVISRDLWLAISSIPEGAPNPFSANVLDRALLNIRQNPDGTLLLPLESELLYSLTPPAGSPPALPSSLRRAAGPRR